MIRNNKEIKTKTILKKGWFVDPHEQISNQFFDDFEILSTLQL